MWVAVTGTPGTGKSSVATVLKKQGYRIVRLHQLARQYNCIDGVDSTRKTQLIDVEKLNTSIMKHFTKEALIFFEGHLSHLLQSMDKVIILRCHPEKLKKRLQKKKWNRKKIKENIDAETHDVILCEAVEHHAEKNIFEINTTEKTSEDVGGIIKNLVKKNLSTTKTYTIGQIDWSEEIVKEDSP